MPLINTVNKTRGFLRAMTHVFIKIFVYTWHSVRKRGALARTRTQLIHKPPIFWQSANVRGESFRASLPSQDQKKTKTKIKQYSTQLQFPVLDSWFRTCNTKAGLKEILLNTLCKQFNQRISVDEPFRWLIKMTFKKNLTESPPLFVFSVVIVKMSLAISSLMLLPLWRMDLFQSLAVSRPLTNWNSFGVSHVPWKDMHGPLLPWQSLDKNKVALFGPHSTSRITSPSWVFGVTTSSAVTACMSIFAVTETLPGSRDFFFTGNSLKDWSVSSFSSSLGLFLSLFGPLFFFSVDGFRPMAVEKTNPAPRRSTRTLKLSQYWADRRAATLSTNNPGYRF